MRTLDLFCGAGGASDGLRAAGLEPVGVEWDALACASHHAAGHTTVRADLAYGPPVVGDVDFLWASPPCTAFSVAGKKHGHDYMPKLLAYANQRLWWNGPEIHDDPNVWLALCAFGAVEDLHPEMVALEQVPGVLPLWRAFGKVLDEWGYSWWAGVLNAADYGVPQTRRRAILMASRVGLAHPPIATHDQTPVDSLFGTTRPWVTMADALGWTGKVGFQRRDDDDPSIYRERDLRSTDRPAQHVTEKARSWKLDRRAGYRNGEPTVRIIDCSTEPAPTFTGEAGAKQVWMLREKRGGERTLDQPALTITGAIDNGNLRWAYDRPSTTIVGSFRPDIVAAPGYRTVGDESRQDAEGSIHISVRDALVLQGFDPERVVLGSKSAQFRQVGNAVPPPIATAVARALIDGAS